MIKTPNELIVSPEQAPERNALLADILARLRLSGALFLRAEYTSANGACSSRRACCATPR